MDSQVSQISPVQRLAKHRFDSGVVQHLTLEIGELLLELRLQLAKRNVSETFQIFLLVGRSAHCVTVQHRKAVLDGASD